MHPETYAAARNRILHECKRLGFTTKTSLKVPQVKLEYGDARRTIYFRKQAVYLDELSMHIDIRGMSADMLLSIALKVHESRLKIDR